MNPIFDVCTQSLAVFVIQDTPPIYVAYIVFVSCAACSSINYNFNTLQPKIKIDTESYMSSMSDGSTSLW